MGGERGRGEGVYLSVYDSGLGLRTLLCGGCAHGTQDCSGSLSPFSPMDAPIYTDLP